MKGTLQEMGLIPAWIPEQIVIGLIPWVEGNIKDAQETVRSCTENCALRYPTPPQRWQVAPPQDHKRGSIRRQDFLRSFCGKDYRRTYLPIVFFQEFVTRRRTHWHRSCKN